MQKKIIILLGIVIIGFLLRFIQVGSNPPGIHADEADTGYTAFSLLKTFHDPYGHFMPLQFQGQANIYRAPLYTYSVIPSVYFLGLSPLSERLPSVIFGTFFIVIIYLIVRFSCKKENIAMATAFLTAINPWSILISRTGVEISLCVLLVSIGILFLILTRENIKNCYYSALFFGLSLFSYHAAKIFVPLFLIFIAIYSHKFLLKNKLLSFGFFVIFGLFFALMAYLALFSKGAAEYHNVTVFNVSRAAEIVNTQRTETLAPLKLSSLFSNKAVYYLREFTNHYIAPISLNYLFVNGESSLDKGLSNYGEFHLFEVPFIIFGIFLLLRKNKHFFYLLCAWIIVGLIPGGITNTGYYTYRDVLIMPPMLIFSGYGAYYLYKLLTLKWRLYMSIYVVFSVILFLFFTYVLFFAYPIYSRDWWAYNQKQVISYINLNKSLYKNIYVHGGMDWNILYAFYNKVQPEDFQKSYKYRKTLGDVNVEKLDGIYFGDLVKNDAKISLSPYFEKNSLLIAPGHYFKNEKPLQSFYSVDGVHADINAFVVQ